MSIKPTGVPPASITGSSLIFRSAMIAIASTIIEPRGTVHGWRGHHVADRVVEGRVAPALEQPGQVAVGENARQLAGGVDRA